MITEAILERIRERIGLRRICEEDGPNVHDDVLFRLTHGARELATEVEPLVGLLVEAGLLDVHLLLDRHTLRFLDDNGLVTARDLSHEPEKPYAEVHFEVDRLSLGNQPWSRLTLKIGEARSFARPKSQDEIINLVSSLIEENSDFDPASLIRALQQYPQRSRTVPRTPGPDA